MSCLEDSSDIIDMDNETYLGEKENLRTFAAVDYVKIVIIVLVMVGSMVGNVSVIIAVALNKSMHNTINIYVLNLSIADFLISTLCMTEFLHKNIAADHRYLFGPLMCKISNFSQMVFLTSSVLTLSAIACDRFTAILFPFRNRITKHRTGTVITAIWLISAAVSFPLILYKKHLSIRYIDFTELQCGEKWPLVYSEETKGCVPLEWPRKCYYTVVSVSLYFVPAAIMLVAYSLILWKVSVSNIPGETSESNTCLQNVARQKVLKMVMTVLLVFIACWTPLQIILLFEVSRTDNGSLPFWFDDVAKLAEFLAFFNSFWNPIIYGIFNQTFRDSLRLVLHCKKRNRQFSTPKTFQRFRLTLTTRLSSSRQVTERISETFKRKQSTAIPKVPVDNPEEVVAKQDDKVADFEA